MITHLPAAFVLAGLSALAMGLVPVASLAHPLPGASITLSHDENSLDVTLTLPMEDLALALPAVAPLADLPALTPVPGAAQTTLATYLNDHLALSAASSGPPLPPLRLISAQLRHETDPEAGPYALVVLTLSSAGAATQGQFPLTLHYDAILHQVRNHRALVQIDAGGPEPQIVDEIRLDLSNGLAAPVQLSWWQSGP